MNALEYLKDLPWLPDSTEGKKAGRPSNSELARWLNNHAVIINGVKPTANEEIEFPITSLIFFPNSERRTTMVYEFLPWLGAYTRKELAKMYKEVMS